MRLIIYMAARDGGASIHHYSEIETLSAMILYVILFKYMDVCVSV